MIKKSDCRDCVWCIEKDNGKYYCKVDKIYFAADADGKVKPPASCHYSVDWRR